MKHHIDLTAAIAGAAMVVNTFLGWLPVLLACMASALSIAWYLVRFYDRKQAKQKHD